MTDRWLGWHFLREDGRTAYGWRKPRPGRMMHCKGPLELCANGLHASVRAIDALSYAPGPIIQRVELVGRRLDEQDKSCARSRRCLWLADATRVLHEFANWCAEGALDTERLAGREPDRRSVEVLAVKRRWLDGQATDEELSYVRGAAWDAVQELRVATREAVWVAAQDAAWAATREAVWVAARAVARQSHNVELHNRLMSLAPEGYTE